MAGILLVVALASFRPAHRVRSRALARAVPLAASVLCVASIMVPWWFVLPQDWTFRASPLYSWLGVPGLLLALYLVSLAVGPALCNKSTGESMIERACR